ncbi:MAG: DUF4345 domain-containing protein [Proteobacteria bacterium]|nr:DUF4345 domain-containing protein [Pseudomonadota bacterium]
MAFHLLRILLFFTSFIIFCVGLSLLFLGPSITFGLLVEFAQPVLNSTNRITDMETPNVDGQIRALAPFLVGYGVLIYLAAKHLRTHLYYVPHLMAVLFAAGIARLISFLSDDAPHQFFVLLLGVELGAPILILLFYKAVVAKVTRG